MGARARGADGSRHVGSFANATYGQTTPAVHGTLVVGRPLRVIPAHQANPGGLRHRGIQAARRATHLTHKHRRPDKSRETDEWIVLFTTHSSAQAAQAAYRQRWAIEGSARDVQGGWDGRHGWDLEPTMAGLTTAPRVDALCGLWAVGTLIQTWLGAQTVAPEVPRQVRDEAASWTTTGRMSVWARGRCVLRDGSGRLDGWTQDTMLAGAERIARYPSIRGDPKPRPLVIPHPRTPIPLPPPQHRLAA